MVLQGNAVEATFERQIDPSDLECLPQLRDPDTKVVRFDLQDQGDSQNIIVWGPYIDLRPGVYMLKFVGEIEGSAVMQMTHNGGNSQLKRSIIGSESQTACFILRHPVSDFEIRLARTPSLRRLTLLSLKLCCAYFLPDARSH